MLEVARGEFFRQLGTTFLKWQQQDLIFSCSREPAALQSTREYDDILAIETWLTSMERVRLSFAYRILKEQTLILEGETFHVATGLRRKSQSDCRTNCAHCLNRICTRPLSPPPLSFWFFWSIFGARPSSPANLL